MYFAVLLWVVRIYRRARRKAMLPGRKLVKRDARPIVLYLRSFQDDSGIKLRARATNGRILLERLIKISFEELVTDHLWRYGPVLAISNSRAKDKLEPLGAAREYATDASWQDKVTDLMQQASMIVAIAGATQGFVWEIDRIARLGFLSKLVLLLPPVATEELMARWQCLASNANFLPRFPRWPGKRPNIERPNLSSEIDLLRTRAVIFTEGRPALILGDKRNDWTYEAVLDEAALMIGVFGVSSNLRTGVN